MPVGESAGSSASSTLEKSHEAPTFSSDARKRERVGSCPFCVTSAMPRSEALPPSIFDSEMVSLSELLGCCLNRLGVGGADVVAAFHLDVRHGGVVDGVRGPERHHRRGVVGVERFFEGADHRGDAGIERGVGGGVGWCCRAGGEQQRERGERGAKGGGGHGVWLLLKKPEWFEVCKR